jgi:glyoxylase-like metal-dependent hydrolase (beta-lactamase superfamily II)
VTHSICTTCGTQFAASEKAPDRCPICDEPRQYVPPAGQSWTTLDALRRSHRNSFRRLEPNLMGIGTTPDFAIGQRALLVQTAHGNVLWDCIALVDQATIDIVNALGGLTAIAISHPHYYTTMVEWSDAFGKIPVYLHEFDRQWVMRPDPVLDFWGGTTRPLAGGLTLIRCGGHFAGGTVLHWPDGAGGKGALLSGDILQVTMDRQFVSFMRSYPNMWPLSRASVESIAAAVAPYEYDRIYGAWWDRHVETDAKAAVARSLERYVQLLEQDDPDGVIRD